MKELYDMAGHTSNKSVNILAVGYYGTNYNGAMYKA